MPTAEQSVDVSVGVTVAYDQWTRFETFPEWMEGVARVEQVDDEHLHWVAVVREEFATVENETREWDARITGQTCDERISWESIPEAPDERPSTGEVRFEPLGESSCRVTFRIGWEPPDALETPSDLLDAMDQVIAADLARFKSFIEAAH